jgi:hypothetical protein
MLERTRIKERRYAVHPWPHADFRESGGHGDHVLLRNPSIDEPLAHSIPQGLERLKPEIPGEKNKLRIGREL